MITITTVIIIISILMVLRGKELLQLTAILMFCYCFPILALFVITFAVLAHHAN
ncbi:MAG: hypothetical protein ACJAS1_005466 [Oleiphilaceae bacterium]|jgi:hypothetical protein